MPSDRWGRPRYLLTWISGPYCSAVRFGALLFPRTYLCVLRDGWLNSRFHNTSFLDVKILVLLLANKRWWHYWTNCYNKTIPNKQLFTSSKYWGHCKNYLNLEENYNHENVFETYHDKVIWAAGVSKNAGVLGIFVRAETADQRCSFYTQDLSAVARPVTILVYRLFGLRRWETLRAVQSCKYFEGSTGLLYYQTGWSMLWARRGNQYARAGLGQPPVSGHYYPQSVRIPAVAALSCWAQACLARPSGGATRYAYEDAVLDHSGEGMYGGSSVPSTASALCRKWHEESWSTLAWLYSWKLCCSALRQSCHEMLWQTGSISG